MHAYADCDVNLRAHALDLAAYEVDVRHLVSPNTY